MTAPTSDDDAQHGQARAQPVGIQAFKCFKDGLGYIHASSTRPSRRWMIRWVWAATGGIMGDDDQGGAFFTIELQQQGHDLLADLGIQVYGRFIGHDDGRLLTSARAMATRCC